MTGPSRREVRGDDGPSGSATTVMAKRRRMTVLHTTGLFRTGLDAHRRGDPATAARLYAEVLARDPDHAPAHFLVAMIERSARRIDSALAHARAAVRIAPQTASYRQGLAEVLLADGRVEEAERAFQAAALCEPTLDAAWAWLAGRREQLGDLVGAERLTRRRRCLSDGRAAATAHAEILARLGDVETAWTLGDRAARTDGPYDAVADLKAGLMLPPIPTNRDQILESRQRLSDALDRVAGSGLRLEDPVSQIGRVPFYLAFHGIDDRALAERFNDVLRAATPAFRTPREDTPRLPGRMRVGVFSTFLNNHTVLRYTEGLIRAMAGRPDLETVAISTTGIPVAARRHLESLGAAVAPVSRHYPQAAAEIQAMHLDVLVFADIGMEPLSAALAHSDLAPRRIVLSGHPVTTGIRGLDGYVTSPMLEPADYAAHYTEPLIEAPFWPLDYGRADPAPSARPVPESDPSKPALICVQSLFKIHPDMDAAFREILARVPGARLHFVGMRAGMQPVTERFRSRLISAGIDVDDRVRFLSRMSLAEYLARLRSADVVLDSWYFSGGDSSLSTLAAGVPIVTLEGAFYRGRQTAALMREIGVPDTIAATGEAYIDLAVSLATDPALAADLRRRVEGGAGRLFGRLDGADTLIDRIVGLT